MALAIFNKMELCGRPLCVDRPAGYTPDMSRPLPAGMIEHGMPSGGLGAPPEKAAAALAATNALAQMAASGPAGPDGSALYVPPSRELCLKNLIKPADVENEVEFKECVADIQEECARFGKITEFKAPHPKDLLGYTDADVGSCFITYELMSAAVKAQADLDGRDFDGATVSAVFVQEDDFELPDDGTADASIGGAAIGGAAIGGAAIGGPAIGDLAFGGPAIGGLPPTPSEIKPEM